MNFTANTFSFVPRTLSVEHHGAVYPVFCKTYKLNYSKQELEFLPLSAPKCGNKLALALED